MGPRTPEPPGPWTEVSVRMASHPLVSRRWDRPRVIAALRLAGAERGSWWTIEEWAAAKRQPCVASVYRWCGSWAEAWALAGYPPPARWRNRPLSRYTEQDLISAVRQAAQALGRSPTSGWYRRWQPQAGAPTLSTITKHLGPWPTALKAAGLAPSEPPAPVDPVATVIALAHTLGRPPTQRDWNTWPARPMSLDVVLRRWGGTWFALLHAARQADAAWPSPMSRSRAVAHLLAQPDHQLTARQRALADLFRAGHSLGRVGAIMGLTRERVRQIAGGNPKRSMRWTHQAVATRLQNWLDTHEGRAPTIAEWSAAGAQPSSNTIIKRCGSWRGAWMALGAQQMPRRGRPSWDGNRETLLARLREWVETHDDAIPTRAAWAREGAPPSAYSIVKAFGSWDAAWRAAVLDAPAPPTGPRYSGS